MYVSVNVCIYQREMKIYIHRNVRISFIYSSKKNGNSSNLQQQVNGPTNCGIFVQWNTTQSSKERKY